MTRTMRSLALAGLTMTASMLATSVYADEPAGPAQAAPAQSDPAQAEGAAGEPAGPVALFDGSTLTGWERRNGTAKYTVEDGAIVGRTAEGSPNSFLATTKEYRDFELTFDVKVDDGLNSGVQIRSTTGDTPDGRVNGPQVEIESGPAEAGYVYGEATGRGWLTPPDRLKPHSHMRNGEWNSFKVRAVGPHIQTWINGTMIEDLTDAEIAKTHPSGFIALQVHSIKKGTGPYEVRWKNIKLHEITDTKDGAAAK